MYLTDREDYLNRERTRNSDNTSINNYNCAGWALKTFCWFSPYNKKDMMNRFDSLYYTDADSIKQEEISEIEDRFFWEDVDYLLNTFKNLKIIDSIDEVDNNDTVIAYRIGVFKFANELDYDFHFKVRRKGKWSEKTGGFPPHECEEEEVFDAWINPYDDFHYSSDLILFKMEE